MRLFVLTSLTMVAFAANSVLNRLALIEPGTGPASFALVRLMAGAAILVALCALRGGLKPTLRLSLQRLYGVGALTLYILGFSFAYISLDAGVGALILFGGVQLTMFAGAVLRGEEIPAQRSFGAVISFLGLVYLMWPTAAEEAAGARAGPDLTGAALMAAGALGWGVYSLLGQRASDPLVETAGNFLWALPVGALAFAIVPDQISPYGVFLAVTAGGLTSGLGYALWYSVLPRLDASVAAIAQLTVPLIAVAGGVLVLGEDVGLRFAVSTALVLGGILIALSAGWVQAGRK